MQLANLAVLEIEPSVRMPWLKWRETNNEIGRYLLPMTICNLTPTCSHAKTSQEEKITSWGISSAFKQLLMGMPMELAQAIYRGIFSLGLHVYLCIFNSLAFYLVLYDMD